MTAADTRWDEGTRASEARRGAVAVRRDDAAEVYRDCDEHPSIPHEPVRNDERDAWCSLCGERLILTGYAGALGYIP